MDKALSLKEINKITGQYNPMITYKELEKYDNIFDVFKDLNTDGFYILYQSSELFGHWVLCFIRPNTNNKEIEFYDSYGEKIDEHVPVMRKYYSTLGRSFKLYPHLSKLLLKTPNYVIIHYNNYPHQEYNNNIATCGRHCAFRYLLKNYDIDTYNKLLGGGNIDKLITYLTDFFL